MIEVDAFNTPSNKKARQKKLFNEVLGVFIAKGASMDEILAVAVSSLATIIFNAPPAKRQNILRAVNRALKKAEEER